MHRTAEHRHRESGFLGVLPVVLGPLLILAAFTGLLALGASLFGWFPKGMQLIAATAGAATLLLAVATAVYLNHQVAAQTAATLSAQNAVARVGSMRAEERLAAFLLNLSQRFTARGFSASDFILRMTREEIGSYLGLKLETVSRSFSRFQDEGLLEVQQKHIRIANIARLKRIMGQSNGNQD